MENRYSHITIREDNQVKTVKIGAQLAPEAIPKFIDKWQSMIDLVTKIADVPTGLIMKLNEDTIEVFLKSSTLGNPYEVGERTELVYGLFCETVIGTQKKLLVADATKNMLWKNNNPDIDLHMLSYLGYPINWPNGEIFGTVCLLDDKENTYNESISEFLFQIKQHIEADLELLVNNIKLEKAINRLESMNDIKTRFLSLISHDIRGGMNAIRSVLKLTLENLGQFDETELNIMLRSLEDSINTTYNTLENLLNWSKNDLLGIEPEKSEVDIIDTLEELLEFFYQPIKLKNIEICKDYISTGHIVYADKNMLTSALRNILSNAIKYNKPNGILFLRVIPVNKKVKIEIEDTGTGMDKDILDSLFSYSDKQEHKNEFGFSSAGIGLMITKDFLDKNDALVEVESTLGIGTKFIITI